MSAVLRQFDTAAGIAELITAPNCDPFNDVGAIKLEHPGGVQTLARWYARYPDASIVRIVAVDSDRALRSASQMREALIAEGIPTKSIGMRRLQGTSMNELGLGWAVVTFPRCFSSAHETRLGASS
jgi:hypothetical protein